MRKKLLLGVLLLTITTLSFGQILLYDQNNSASANGITSQLFADFPTFTNQAADDFVVPAGPSWSVSRIIVGGLYYNGTGPAPLVNVYFYNNSGSLPGTLVASALNNAIAAGAGTGNFTIDLALPVSLTAGTYWVSVQAVMSFGVGGQWGWNTRTTTALNEAAWRNPGGGFATPCTNWGVMPTCLTQPNGDMMFSLWGTTVLPVSMVSFTASNMNNRAARLRWETSFESNNAGFEIERSKDGINYTKIGFEGTKGNGSSGHVYFYTDVTPAIGANFYRLKQVNTDGQFHYTTTSLVNIKSIAGQSMLVYPNPVAETLNISFQSNVAEAVTVKVTDMMGRVIISSLQNSHEGNNNIALNATSLSKGMYMIQIISDSEGTQSFKILKK